MLYDVFISCTSTEVKIAERLSAYLEYYNVQCFVANRDLPADVPWTQGIAEAIKNSKMMIAIFTEDFNSGTWMDGELKTAVDASVPILTFRLSDVPYGETKADFLKGTAFVDGTNDIEGNFPKLYEEVCNLLGMPIENALPVDEVLVDEKPAESINVQNEWSAPQNNSIPAEKSEDKQKSEKEEVSTPAPSHNILSAVVIGVLLTLAVMVFLEWILA